MNIKHAIASRNDSIRHVLHLIDNAASRGGEPGIAVIVDEHNVVVGVVTDGDVRSALCRNVDFASPVETIMSGKFVFVYDHVSPLEQLKTVLQKVNEQKRLKDPRLTKVVVCSEKMEFVDIVNFYELYRFGDISLRKIAVYGMGYVGLTLALTLAELGEYAVVGLDINERTVEQLNNNEAPFYEEGIDSLLRYCRANSFISFQGLEKTAAADIHIIAVGTPLTAASEPDYSQLEAVGRYIGRDLKEGDLVVCRSTVPAGTTRNCLIPILQQSSGLAPGRDFFVSFAPERTVEGNALRELKTLPQIVGGYSQGCAELTTKLFQKITPSIVQVKSLEASEIVKLINNTYRDTIFSFANEVAMLCDLYNLDAFEVIESANEGYARSMVPRPSPGVGGACLVKDPYLFTSHPWSDKEYDFSFGRMSRRVNKSIPQYVYRQFELMLERYPSGDADTKVLVAGLAFKGYPETSDMRFSPALDLIELLSKGGYVIQGFDWVVPAEDIRKLGIGTAGLDDGFKGARAVFFMNDHAQNTKFNLYEALMNCCKPFLFFDGWKMFSKKEIESVPGVYYATMGYNSLRK